MIRQYDYDGGVCFFKVKRPDDYRRLFRLLKPFYPWFENNPSSNQDTVHFWLDAHLKYQAPEYLIGSYGSHREFSLNQLKLTLNPEIVMEDVSRTMCPDPSMTFMELLVDLSTRQMYFSNREGLSHLDEFEEFKQMESCLDSNGRFLSRLELILWESFGTRISYLVDLSPWYDRTVVSIVQQTNKEFDPIRHLTITEWADEIRSLVDLDSLQEVETWT